MDIVKKYTQIQFIQGSSIYRSFEKKIFALLAIFTSSHRAAIVKYDTYNKERKAIK